MSSCPFCLTEDLDILQHSELSISFFDTYPVSPGHALIVPKRHVESFFDLTTEEQTDLLGMMSITKKIIDSEFSPSGYNIGINDGKSAGQTIMHVHVHMVPRYDGDTSDPRGGLRWIFPDKANYWEKEK